MSFLEFDYPHNSHPMIIKRGAFSDLLNQIRAQKLFSNFFIVVDKNVNKIHARYIKDCFDEYSGKKFLYLFDAVEKSKSLFELQKIYKALVKNNFGRDTLLISIGGGVTGDLSGFAASTYNRGIQLLHIPTTLTACVDSSVGGKTGINFDYYKNVVGTYFQPSLVICDLKFLETLPKDEMYSGFGEIIKYAFISDSAFFDFVKKNSNQILHGNSSVLEEAIVKSVNFKTSVVRSDEKELSIRKVLNFGHTFAHAIEKELKYSIKHGEAVTFGIICALFLSYKKKLISEKELKEFLRLPLSIKPNPLLKAMNAESVYRNMSLDKKNRNQKIKFVLIRNIGEMVVDVEASQNEVIHSINSAINLLFFK